MQACGITANKMTRGKKNEFELSHAQVSNNNNEIPQQLAQFKESTTNYYGQSVQWNDQSVMWKVLKH